VNISIALAKLVTELEAEEGLEESSMKAELAVLVVDEASQASKLVALFMVVKVSSEEVKMPSSTGSNWLVEADRPVVEEIAVVAIFNLGSSIIPKSVGVWGKLLNPSSPSPWPSHPLEP
jgi:hypothetical protein